MKNNICFTYEKWDKDKEKTLNDYLYSIARLDRAEWTARIVNTKMKVLSIDMNTLNEIVKEIRKGDIYSYLDLKNFQTLESMVIYGKLLIYINDINIIKKYLLDYLPYVDNWHLIDIISFKIKKDNTLSFYNLAKELIAYNKTFYIRMGVRILFNMLSFDEYLDCIFEILGSLKSSEEYYVNMMVAWTLCELFIKQRNKTLSFLEKGEYNDFVANKTVSKCRDSFRVSKEDKEMLLKFKRK